VEPLRVSNHEVNGYYVTLSPLRINKVRIVKFESRMSESFHPYTFQWRGTGSDVKNIFPKGALIENLILDNPTSSILFVRVATP
jgi:hypothetical protein